MKPNICLMETNGLITEQEKWPLMKTCYKYDNRCAYRGVLRNLKTPQRCLHNVHVSLYDRVRVSVCVIKGKIHVLKMEE